MDLRVKQLQCGYTDKRNLRTAMHTAISSVTHLDQEGGQALLRLAAIYIPGEQRREGDDILLDLHARSKDERTESTWSGLGWRDSGL